MWVCKIGSSQNFLSTSVRYVYLHCCPCMSDEKSSELLDEICPIYFGYQTTKSTSPTQKTENSVDKDTMWCLSSAVNFICSTSTKQTITNSCKENLENVIYLVLYTSQ